MTKEELALLTTTTSAFMNHVHCVRQSFNLIPNRDHHGVCINYVDRIEYKDQFCEELVNTISEWIYSSSKAAKIVDTLILQGRSGQNAQSALRSETFKKFRRSTKDLFSQGQFGELLLFNFLQSLFKAVPLIRKMPLTTGTDMERFGADAIHYAFTDKHILFLGEAKTYTSKYKFNEAFADAIESILGTYQKHVSEIGSYIYDDFIEAPLVKIAQDYKNGLLKDVEVHLVCVIVYNETKDFAKDSEEIIKEKIMKIIEDRGLAVERKVFDVIDKSLHPRFNYIIFPVWELDKLILNFQKLIGK